MQNPGIHSIRIGGMHLDFRAFGHVVKSATGYSFVPMVWRQEA